MTVKLVVLALAVVLILSFVKAVVATGPGGAVRIWRLSGLLAVEMILVATAVAWGSWAWPF